MGLESFADFLELTRDEKLDPAEVIRTVCMKHNYTFGELVRGKDMKTLSQGGETLKMFLRVALVGSYQQYGVGQNWTPVSGDSLKPISVAWKFNNVGFGWYDEENLLNKYGVSSFADVLDVYEGGMRLDFIDGVENDLWAVPNTADMEASTGISPYSIPCYVNELSNTVPSGFSTVMGLSPTTYTVWQNQKAGYRQSEILSPTSPYGLAAALEVANSKIKYKTTGWSQSSKYEHGSNGRVLLLTNLDGLSKYRALLRAMNDRTFKAQDIAYQNITFDDNDIIWVEKLDTAAIYSGTLAASHTNGVANAGYPRFYGITTADLHPILSSHMYFERMKVEKGGLNRPNYNHQFCRTGWNLACKDRRTQYIVYPSD